MKEFIIKINALVAFIVMITLNSNAQIKVADIVQESSIATSESNQLYFVDFWATWCGPCVYAKKMLTVLQKQQPDGLYIISLSDENKETVDRYLLKKPSELAIAVDFEANTFKKFDVTSRPYGILFNAKGDKLWEGHPADLSKGMINKFLRNNKAITSLNNFIQIIRSDKSLAKDYQPKSDIEFFEINHTEEIISIEETNSYLKLDGSLKYILGYLAKIYENQIELPSELNSAYQVYFKKPYNKADNLAYKLIKELGYGVKRFEKEGDLLSLELTPNTSFWETNIIDWGNDSPDFLVSDSDIKADNVSLKELSYQLAHVLNIPVIISNEDERCFVEHDWDIHYKFYELMQSSLLDNYGIKIEKQKDKFPVYQIIKKAP